jgi:hypothetical protein
VKKVSCILAVVFPLLTREPQIGLEGYVPVAIAYDENKDCFGIAAVTEEIDQEFGDLVRTGSFHIMNGPDQIGKSREINSDMTLKTVLSLERLRPRARGGTDLR